jgi:hypothetical protein
MKDPTTPDSENRKKIMFYDTAEHQTKLRIRCDFDGITQSQFFRMMLIGYVEGDELIYEFMKKCKERHGVQGQQKRKKIDTINREAKKINKAFGLESDELESIFDIIEMETDL